MRSAWDKLEGGARPVDKTSARAVSGGCGYDVLSGVRQHDVHSDVPLKTVAPPPDVPDFTGKRLDRLRVIGWAADHTGKHGMARWVVRCDCGTYELRRTRVLRRHNEEHCCKRCGKLDYVRRIGSSVKGRTV